jgi:hypothetical protein
MNAANLKTSAGRQQWAQAGLDARAAKDTAMAVAREANARDEKRLADLATEIAGIESRLDPENLQEVQTLTARREQISQLRRKYAADADARLKNAGCDVVFPEGNFKDVVSAELDAIMDALLPFCRNRETAARLARESDSGVVLVRFQAVIWSQGEISNEDFLRALRCLAAGRAWWEW